MGTLRNRDRLWEHRNALKGFTEDALTISVRSFFQKRGRLIAESVLATAETTFLLVDLIGVAAKLLESCFIRDMLKPFHELQSEHLHHFQCLRECEGNYVIMYA